MDDPESLSQPINNPIPPALDFPPSVTVHGQNTQCVTMLKIRGAAGDRVQLLQVPGPTCAPATCAPAVHTPSRCRQEPSLLQPRRKDADTTQTIAFGSRWLLLFRYFAIMNTAVVMCTLELLLLPSLLLRRRVAHWMRAAEERLGLQRPPPVEPLFCWIQ